MQHSTLQLRMVGNMQMQQNLFNAAQDDLNNDWAFYARPTRGAPHPEQAHRAGTNQQHQPELRFGQVKIDAYGSADGDNNLTIKPAYSNNIVPYVAGDASTSQNKIRALDIPTASSEYSLKTSKVRVLVPICPIRLPAQSPP